MKISIKLFYFNKIHDYIYIGIIYNLYFNIINTVKNLFFREVITLTVT